MLHHHFVIADISVSVLLVLDFIKKYKVVWDWWKACIKYDNVV